MNAERLELGREAQRIIRFHIMPTNELQTVGAHTFGLCLILLEFYDGSEVPISVNLMRAALYHDVPEARVGDVPSPTFRKYPELGEWVKKAEDDIMSTHDMNVTLTSDEQRQLKLADRLELALFAIEDYMRGNRRAGHALSRVLHYTFTEELVQTDNEQAVLNYIVLKADEAGMII